MNPLNPKDVQELKQLIEFLKENQVAEFELDRGDLKIRLKLEQPQAAQAGISDLASLLAGARAASSPQTATAAASQQAAELAADPDAGLHIVKSPIVGTFYGSPTPGSAPFVNPGDHVDKGQVIGIVDAMKLMNTMESAAAGEVVKCFVSDGQPIEFGQPLYSVRLG